MPSLFRRRSRGPEGRVEAFWAWWSAEGRRLAERSIAGELEPAGFATLMTTRVQEVAPLAWELAAGDLSRHVLVITAEGDPSLWAPARRMVLAAPPVDETWSYVDARPPAPDPEGITLSAGEDAEVRFADIRVGARKEGNHFDVAVHHPAFPDLPELARRQITVLALDAALGEVDTELWLGQIDDSEVEPLDGFGLVALRSVVHDLKAQQLDADGNPGWVLLQGETPDGPLLATARSPLHPRTAPHLDTHVAVVLPYAEDTDDGLPDEDSLDALRRFEDRLAGELGRHGSVVGHQSTGGVRTLHVYVDSTAGVVPTVARVARDWDLGRASVHDMADPSWQAVAHLRV